MARTISEIYDAMIAEKEAMTELAALQPLVDSSQTLLSDLTSTSKAAVWRLMFWVVAVAMWTLEKLWDVFKAEVDAIVDTSIPGTAQWYRDQCFLFQYGYEMVYSNYRFNYEISDATKQIIKRASVQEFGGSLLIKVAKEESGNVVPLDTDELEAFSAYINQIKFAGTFINIISLDSDLINITLTVYYDAKVMNSSGQLLSNTGVEPVTNAIEEYLATLPFNGVYRNSDMINAVHAADGVVDVVAGTVQAKSNDAANYTTVNRIYQTVSGHIELNTLNVTYHV